MPKRRRFTVDDKKRFRTYYAGCIEAGVIPSQDQLIVYAKNVLKIDIDQSQVSRWLSNKNAKLDDAVIGSAKTIVYRKKSRPLELLEKALYEWTQRYESDISISQSLLKTKARIFFHRLPFYYDTEEPKFSNGWCEGFQKTYGIAWGKKHGEIGSAMKVNVDEEVAEIVEILRPFGGDDIYNCDETGLYFKAIPDSSLSTKPLPGVKIAKARMTFHHTVNSTGSDRVPMWVFNKSLKPHCFRGIKIETFNIHWRANKKAWMNTGVMVNYLTWFDERIRASRRDRCLYSAFITAQNTNK